MTEATELTATERATAIIEAAREQAKRHAVVKGTGAWIGSPDKVNVHNIDLETFGILARMLDTEVPTTLIEHDLYVTHESFDPYANNCPAKISYYSSKHNKRGERG